MRFSITIPSYKPNYLSRAIKSCLTQTFNDFEIIIVDDCSPYDLKSIVDSFTDSRIHYFRNKKNCGAVNVVDNWNICLSYCKGDWIICMGDDDMLEPDALEEYNRLILKYPEVNAIHGRVRQIDENDNTIRILPEMPEKELVSEFILARLNNRVQYIGDFCFRIRLLREEGGYVSFPLAWGSDDATSFMMAKKGMVHTKVPVFSYRINPYTISNTGNTIIKLDAINKKCKWFYSFIKGLGENSIKNKNIINVFERFVMKERARAISSDLITNQIYILKWLVLGWRYNVSLLSLAYGIKYAYNKKRRPKRQMSC